MPTAAPDVTALPPDRTAELVEQGWPPLLAECAARPADLVASVRGLGLIRFCRVVDRGGGWVRFCGVSPMYPAADVPPIGSIVEAPFWSVAWVAVDDE